MTATLRVATRGSALARWQAERVVARLTDPAELVIVSTTGDRDRTSALHAIGGTGVFVKEVQDAVARGDADVAVHSAKDLPATPGDLVLAAVPERADVRDAVVGTPIEDIPSGGTIATGSVRRRAQLAAVRPDLTFAELRGNVPTRVERAAEFDAIVLATAGLERLGLADRIAERLDFSLMLPMVGQAAIAVECRPDDERVRATVASIDDPTVHRAVVAERAFLRTLGGGCTMPCAAHASIAPDGTVWIEALLASLDGRTLLRTVESGPDADAVGVRIARAILEDLGGSELLASPTPETLS
jgi:hydroxymethylbilane synthase